MDKNNIYNTTEALPVPPKPTQYQVIEVLNRANEVIYRLREENTALKDELDRITTLVADFERSVL